LPNSINALAIVKQIRKSARFFSAKACLPPKKYPIAELYSTFLTNCTRVFLQNLRFLISSVLVICGRKIGLPASAISSLTKQGSYVLVANRIKLPRSYYRSFGQLSRQKTGFYLKIFYSKYSFFISFFSDSSGCRCVLELEKKLLLCNLETF